MGPLVITNINIHCDWPDLNHLVLVYLPQFQTGYHSYEIHKVHICSAKSIFTLSIFYGT